MRLSTIANIAGARFVAAGHIDPNIRAVCAADLMSDVLAFAEPGCLLLTGLCNPQVIRTAEMADINAVMFVHGKAPTADTIALAESKSIPLLSTSLSMFEVCGRLYQSQLADEQNRS